MEDTISLILTGVAGLLIAYSLFMPRYPDLNPFFLKNQSSVSPIRSPGETAVYRSLVTPHGRQLITGLSITSGSRSTTRNGTLTDLLKLLLAAKVYNAAEAVKEYDLVRVTSSDLEELVSGLADKIKEHSDKADAKIAVLLPNGLFGLLTIFTGASVVFCPTTDVDPEQITSYLNAISPVGLVATDEIIEAIDLSKSPSVKFAVTTGTKRFQNPLISDWQSMRTKTPVEVPEDAVASIGFLYDDNGKLDITQTDTEMLVSAIAAQIRALPKSQQWDSKDRVLAFATKLTPYSLLTQLTAVAVGASIYFPSSPTFSDPLMLVRDTSATILITDDETSMSFLNLIDELTILYSIRYLINLYNLGGGVHDGYKPIPELKTVRLIHSASMPEKNREQLTNSDVKRIKALTGARLVHAFCTKDSIGPITQTNMYDYRSSQNGDNNESTVNYGPVLPNIEAVLRDSDEDQVKQRTGELWVRGPSVGFEWTNTKVKASWGRDGCLKV